MTREEAIRELKIEFLGEYDRQREAKNMAIKALEQQPSEDCVSRQAVLERINDWWGITSTSGEPTLCDCIRELPSVTPTTCIAKVTFSKDDLQELVDEKVKELAQRMEGRWIPVSERLPEEEKIVIASTEYGLLYPEARYTKEGWKWAYESGADYWENLENVLAWMPLPKPYEVEMEDEDGH